MREEFEKWWNELNSGKTKFLAIVEAWLGYQAGSDSRQPEIDALKAELKEESDVVAGLFGMGLEIQKERDQLRARVAELEGGRDELARQIGELTTDDKGMKILSLLTVREHDKAMIDAQGDLIARMRLALGKAVHYPECWDEINYPTLGSAINEVLSCHAAGADVRCTNENCVHASPPAPVVPEWRCSHANFEALTRTNPITINPKPENRDE